MANTKTISKTLLVILRISRMLWVRVTLMACLAVVASFTAMLLDTIIPDTLRQRFTPDTVMPILTILASGMLAVSTFSLNVMVTAHNVAAAQATPRAHRILLADTTTQTVLATFIGAFVYALTSIILLQAELHDPGTSVAVLVFTVVVVVLVILAMLRWIDHLSDLGSMDKTLHDTEAEARSSLMRTRETPALRANALTPDTVMPQQMQPILSPRSGYLQFIDLRRMSACLRDNGARIYIHAPPGRFVLEGTPLAYATGLDGEGLDTIKDCLTIGDHRTFEQDAAYGLLVMSEIASRALSPGINDPGTAIDVISRQERLLWAWANTPVTNREPIFPRIFVPDTSPVQLIEGAFASTARDGAGLVEVASRLQIALGALAKGPDTDLAGAAREMAARALAYSEKALVLEEDKKKVRARQSAGGVNP
jgi:uncharacterized membrane protein